jgi:hypothetical protein
MKNLILSLMIVCSLSYGKTPLQYATEMEQSVETDRVDFPIVKKYADQAVDGALKRAIKELRKKGYSSYAQTIEFEWTAYYGNSLFTDERNIGDHKPINQWLAEKYQVIEMFLGVEVCKALHISDIKTLNFGIPVTIHPCSFPMDLVQGERVDEYVRHFAGGPNGDDTYYGVIPVITYWAVVIPLTPTLPIGAGIVASIAERLMDIAAVSLGKRVYEKRCGGSDA